MPTWPMEMPSETEIVPNSIGKPPAWCTPSLDAVARRSSERLQGVISFQLDATPIWGLEKSSSVIPTARSMPRAAARSIPSVTSRLRGLTSCSVVVPGPAVWFAMEGTVTRRPDTGSTSARGGGELREGGVGDRLEQVHERAVGVAQEQRAVAPRHRRRLLDDLETVAPQGGELPVDVVDEELDDRRAVRGRARDTGAAGEPDVARAPHPPRARWCGCSPPRACRTRCAARRSRRSPTTRRRP